MVSQTFSPLSSKIATNLPTLAAAAIKELYPAYPADYFKPTPWEPSDEDIVKFSSGRFDEEVIRCPCGSFIDEGTMTECDQCKVRGMTGIKCRFFYCFVLDSKFM